MNLSAHPSYERLVALARRCHDAGRCTHPLTPADIDLARLYSYAYRAHVIGAFHATRLALEATPPPDRALAYVHRTHAAQTMADLADLSMDPILPDARALLSTFYRYDQGVRRVLGCLDHLEETGRDARIAQHFRQVVQHITGSAGIVLTRDIDLAEQGDFIVPNLGISIMPLVYGDYHSWNLACLPGPKANVPCHRHHDGVEIHLGYSPMQGDTILGSCRAEVSEGYAMPIPPRTSHGYVNGDGKEHQLPFIYGSLKAGGWGVFLDVEPQPRDVKKLKRVALDSDAMNDSVHLEREIARAEALTAPRRSVIVKPEATNQHGCGGLELAVARVNSSGMRLPKSSFRIVSVVRGEGTVEMAGIEQTLTPHDHFGIPEGMLATIWQRGRKPLVFLDTMLQG